MTLLSRAQTSLIAGAIIVASTLAGAQPAAAADGKALTGSAAATDIDVLNGVVTSGPTASSTVTTTELGQSNTNRLLDLDIAGLVHAKTLDTKVVTSAVDGGQNVTSTAQAAGVELLGGAITVEAITTTSSVTLANGEVETAGDTELVGVTVGSQKLPIRVSPNTKIGIPGLAEVVINKVESENVDDTSARVAATGIEITLLKAVANAPAGATILVTPTNAAIGDVTPSEGPALSGYGYALSASVKALGTAIKGLSGPIAVQYLPQGGTGNREVPKAIAAVNLAPIVKASALGTSVKGSRTSTASAGTVTAHAAKVNLLGGLITADVVESTASGARNTGADAADVSGSSKLVNLKIAGAAIPLEVPANTAIKIPGLATVTLNEQTTTAKGIRVSALHVVVTAGLLAGADIDLATAYIAVGE